MTVQPEQMSLSAHKHIQKLIQKLTGNSTLAGDDLTAVLRLSQHLRVFGLLSAVGYVNQSNAQEGQVRQRIAPVWELLLGQLLDEKNPLRRADLMKKVVEMAEKEPALYMETWRRSLVLTNHWNFWARAYQEVK
jgi:glucan phosphorylase